MNHVTDQRINPNRQLVFCDRDKLGAVQLSVCFNVFPGFQTAIFPAKYPSALWPLQTVVEFILRLMNAIRIDHLRSTPYGVQKVILMMILRPHGVLRKRHP